MRVNQFGLAALFAAAGVAVAIGAAPIAVADDCDPTASICQGPDLSQASDSSLGPAPDIDDPTRAGPGFEGGATYR
jgi:hypothetical protein